LGTQTGIAHVEEPICVRLDRIVFRGVVDRVDEVDGGIRVVDYKGQTERVEYDYQVRFYAWLLGESKIGDVTEGWLCYLQVPTKTVPVDVTERSLADIGRHARELERATESGRFDPKPGAVCSSCGVMAICPSAGPAGRG
jgi:putative RecB family exonuclease